MDNALKHFTKVIASYASSRILAGSKITVGLNSEIMSERGGIINDDSIVVRSEHPVGNVETIISNLWLDYGYKTELEHIGFSTHIYYKEDKDSIKSNFDGKQVEKSEVVNYALQEHPHTLTDEEFKDIFESENRLDIYKAAFAEGSHIYSSLFLKGNVSKVVSDFLDFDETGKYFDTFCGVSMFSEQWFEDLHSDIHTLFVKLLEQNKHSNHDDTTLKVV